MDLKLTTYTQRLGLHYGNCLDLFCFVFVFVLFLSVGCRSGESVSSSSLSRSSPPSPSFAEPMTAIDSTPHPCSHLKLNCCQVQTLSLRGGGTKMFRRLFRSLISWQTVTSSTARLRVILRCPFGARGGAGAGKWTFGMSAGVLSAYTLGAVNRAAAPLSSAPHALAL